VRSCPERAVSEVALPEGVAACLPLQLEGQLQRAEDPLDDEVAFILGRCSRTGSRCEEFEAANRHSRPRCGQWRTTLTVSTQGLTIFCTPSQDHFLHSSPVSHLLLSRLSGSVRAHGGFRLMAGCLEPHLMSEKDFLVAVSEVMLVFKRSELVWIYSPHSGCELLT